MDDFKKLPDDPAERGEFAKLFRAFNTVLEAARIQGFKWDQSVYQFGEEQDLSEVELHFTEETYLILAVRYKELASGGGGGGGGGTDDIPYDIDGYLTEIDTDRIDADYMHSRFEKYLKTLQGGDGDAIKETLAELHRSFASLTQEEQKIADIFLHDIQRGDVVIDSARPFKEYITQYQMQTKNREVNAISQLLGVDEAKLTALMINITEANINEYGCFDELKETVDKQKAKAYFESVEGQSLPPFRVNIKTANLLQKFIIEGGFELDLPECHTESGHDN